MGALRRIGGMEEKRLTCDAQGLICYMGGPHCKEVGEVSHQGGGDS